MIKTLLCINSLFKNLLYPKLELVYEKHVTLTIKGGSRGEGRKKLCFWKYYSRNKLRNISSKANFKYFILGRNVDTHVKKTCAGMRKVGDSYPIPPPLRPTWICQYNRKLKHGINMKIY